jgi:hypothetical protein
LRGKSINLRQNATVNIKTPIKYKKGKQDLGRRTLIYDHCEPVSEHGVQI